MKIYLCPDKFSSRLQSDYSLLPDILLDAIPVYTAVNHRLPITFLHKTRLVFKSGHKNEGRRWDNWTQASLRALTEHEHSSVCASVFVESPICFLTYFLLSKGDIGPPSILSHYFFLKRFSLIQNTHTDYFCSFKKESPKFILLKSTTKETLTNAMLYWVTILWGLLCFKWISHL